jgi:hypothetical protein
MRLFFFSAILYSLNMIILFRGFKKNFFSIRHLFTFSITFWVLFTLVHFDGITQNLASTLGFKVASNLIYVCAIALLFLAFIRIKLELIRVQRTMRHLIYQIEFNSIKKDFERE